jgi:hypothetical protein
VQSDTWFWLLRTLSEDSANHEALSLARHGVELLELMPLSQERTANENIFSDCISILASGTDN